MSETELQLACPGCQARFSFVPATLLTPDSPHLGALLAGTLNCVKCPQCGKILNIPLRLTYRDTEKPFIVVQEPHPLPPAAAAKTALALDESATAAAREKGLQRPVVRLVFTRPDFLEKIHLHRHGFDDRIMEYAKYQLFNGGAEAALSPDQHRLLYDFTRPPSDSLQFIIFQRKNGRPLRMLQVPLDEFRKLEEECRLNPAVQAELDRAFPGCRVDVDRLFEDAKHN